MVLRCSSLTLFFFQFYFFRRHQPTERKKFEHFVFFCFVSSFLSVVVVFAGLAQFKLLVHGLCVV